MLYDVQTIQETKEVEEVRDGHKCKVRYLVQKRMVPVRKEAVDLLKKLKANIQRLPDDIKTMNTNGQNLVRNTLGTTFNEGNREDNVTKQLVKDKDKVSLLRLEKEKTKVGVVDMLTDTEKKQRALQEKYSFADQPDVQHTFRITHLALNGNSADPVDFAEGKAEFEEFLDGIKDYVLQRSKVRLRFHTNFRKSMHNDVFTGVVNFYFEDQSQAILLKNELEGAVFNNYEIFTEWFERRPPQPQP